MYLKKITLRGFKSFAKKSQLTFDRGINVIVGPNGSGKSNIIDAISWVLGEQSPKSLRGSSMDDVIFRSKKEELAIAEVSLLFDNEDRFLPLNFNEVKFSRRVFQEGGSEYFINSSPSRLFDIHDITSEGGIGKGLYTIINQGKIDDIALLKPFERKALIDELIGIAKHKVRREKSKKKLDKVKSDVDRINDLISEVKRTMDPLELEAKKAQRHSEMVNRLKKAEMEVFIYDINVLNRSWDRENKKYDNIKKQINKKVLQVKKIEKEKEDFDSEFKIKQLKFEKMKSIIDDFKSFDSEFNTLYRVSESKKNVFKTLANMLEAESSSLKVSKDFLDERISKEKLIFGNKDLLLKRLIDIRKKVERSIKKIIDFIEEKKIRKKIESELSELVKEISDTISLIEKDKVKEERTVDSNSKNIRQNLDKSKIDIDRRIESIEKLIDYSAANIEKSGHLYSLVESFTKALKTKKTSFLPSYDEIVVDMNSYNRNLNDYMKNINEMVLSKKNLENELYRIEIEKEQIKEKVKDLTEKIIDSYNLPVEYIFNNYSAAGDIKRSRKNVQVLKKEVKKIGVINPNATIEYKKIKKRYNFLEEQRDDLIKSKNSIIELIDEINIRIDNIFNEKFDLVNKNFNEYFKSLFPMGNGEMILVRDNTGKSDYGIELKVDIGNDKMVPLSLLSGGEKALVSIAFLFSIFATSSSPFYVFDEIDASLDDINLNRFVALVKKFAYERQIIIVTHQKKTMEIADTIYGVTMQSNSISKVISERLEKTNAEIN